MLHIHRTDTLTFEIGGWKTRKKFEFYCQEFSGTKVVKIGNADMSWLPSAGDKDGEQKYFNDLIGYAEDKYGISIKDFCQILHELIGESADHPPSVSVDKSKVKKFLCMFMEIGARFDAP